MRRALLQLAAGLLLALLAPAVGHAQPPALTLQAPAPAGDERAVVVARLADARGAPVAGATVRFYVDDAYDGQARTGADGRASWRLRHRLRAGRYQIAAVFEGSAALAPARAEQQLRMMAPQIELSATPAAARLGDPIVLRARVTNADGAPAPRGRLLVFVNGERRAEIRTDANGLAERTLKGDLPAGTYDITAEFAGLPGLLPARAELPLTIGPTLFVVRTVPALAGVRFALDERVFVSGEDGAARIQVGRPGLYRLQVLPWDRDASGMRAEFDRWEDPFFDAARAVRIPAKLQARAGFDVSYLVAPEFTDPAGRPVDPARISAFRFTSSYGTNYDLPEPGPRWLKGIHVVRGPQGLAASPVVYTVEGVMIDGANVVNQAQQRFTSAPGARWTVQVQLYDARFVARDALFGFPIGSSLSLMFPDGQAETRALGPDADVTFPALARGAYTVTLDAPGMSGVTPAAISHHQEVRLLVLSYLDMAVIGGFLAIIALVLLVLGRPWLPALLRDPAGLARQLAVSVRQAPARLRVPALWRGLAPAGRGQLRRADPALIAASLLVSLGGLGAVLGPGVAAREPAATPPPRAASQPRDAAAPPQLPTATPLPGAALLPTAAPARLAPQPLGVALAKASSGAEVVHLQQRLRELGYFSYPENTGFYGALTAQAVARFQRARGLAATGEADSATIDALNACDSTCALPRPE